MKRLGALAVICALIFSLAACGSTDKGAGVTTAPRLSL